jgi:hypothetical protein
VILISGINYFCPWRNYLSSCINYIN